MFSVRTGRSSYNHVSLVGLLQRLQANARFVICGRDSLEDVHRSNGYLESSPNDARVVVVSQFLDDAEGQHAASEAKKVKTTYMVLWL